MIKIPLRGNYKNLFIIIDDEDFAAVNQHKWCLTSRRYAGTMIDKKSKLLHRFLLNYPIGFQIDHINGNSLDNRRSNLRICSGPENRLNKGFPKNNTSGYKGVYLRKDIHQRKRHWHAYINAKRKRIHLGEFFTAREAAMAYNRAALKYHGIYAKLNEVNGSE